MASNTGQGKILRPTEADTHTKKKPQAGARSGARSSSLPLDRSRIATGRLDLSGPRQGGTTITAYKRSSSSVSSVSGGLSYEGRTAEGSRLGR
jgi:hypothetical protein